MISVKEDRFYRDIHNISLELGEINKSLKKIIDMIQIEKSEQPADSRENSDV
jgi:hypothetical protein